MPRESAIEFWPLGEVYELSCRFALLGVLRGEYNFEKLASVRICDAPPVVSVLVPGILIHGILIHGILIHGIYVVFLHVVFC
jgi:hypothetical protein